MSQKSAFVFSELFEQFQAHENYPWLFARSRVTYDLCRANGLIKDGNTKVVNPIHATRDQLATYHKRAYLDLLLRANVGVFEEAMLKNGLGTLECPVYKGCFEYHSLAVGATINAAQLLQEGVDVVFSPTGGFHHAGPDFASGFCYLNDINIALNLLVEEGHRVFYVDIDAHHCDMVQDAFYEDDRVLTLSFHESGKSLFPWASGFETELGRGKGEGFCVNVPLPAETDDESFLWAFTSVFPPLCQAFEPDMLVAVLGADTLYSDLNSHLRVTNSGYCQAVKLISQQRHKLLAVGGGGYNLDSLSRAWTLAWAIISGFSIEDESEFSFGGQFWGDRIASLRDRPLFIPSDTREANRRECERVVNYIEKNAFPFHHIAR